MAPQSTDHPGTITAELRVRRAGRLSSPRRPMRHFAGIMQLSCMITTKCTASGGWRGRMGAVSELERPARRVIVLGGGPGGYEAALVAAQLGADVTVVERDGTGGAAVLTDVVP